MCARPLKRAIQNFVEDKIAESILDGIVSAGETIKITIDNDEVKVIPSKSLVS